MQLLMTTSQVTYLLSSIRRWSLTIYFTEVDLGTLSNQPGCQHHPQLFKLSLTARRLLRRSPEPSNVLQSITFQLNLLPHPHEMFNCWSVSSTKPLEVGSHEAHPKGINKMTSFHCLDSCIGLLFLTILKNHWVTDMVENKFLDRSIQKAFYECNTRLSSITLNREQS